MATSIYLGNPPPKIKEWIEKNYVKPIVFKDETQVTYIDGTTWEGLIEGTLRYNQIPNKEIAKDVILGTSITDIGDEAFVEFESLTSLKIPDSVTDIAGTAFDGITNNELFDTTTLPGFALIDGWLVRRTMGSGYPSEIVFNGVRGIGSDKLGSNNYLYSTFVIPPSVIHLGEYAFTMTDMAGVEKITFTGRTLDEVKNMKFYPWDSGSAIIHAEN